MKQANRDKFTVVMSTLKKKCSFFGWIISLSFIPPIQSLAMTEIYSDGQYGYLIKHPSHWDANSYRSGDIASEVLSRKTDSGLQIRLMRYSGEPISFIKKHVKSIERSLNAKLTHEKLGSNNGYEFHESEFDSIRNGQRYKLFNRLIFYPSKKTVAVMQSGCKRQNMEMDLLIIKEIANSFWVFNKEKLKPRR